MAERKINPVKDNKEKQITYRTNINRYNAAVKSEFYYEGLLIDYALMEDRLRSLLFHMAFLRTTEDTGAWKRTRPFFKSMVETYIGAKAAENLGITSITGKVKIVRAVLLWVRDGAKGREGNKYLDALASQWESGDVQGLLDTLDALQDWCKYRNEIIHCLLNKNIDSVDAELKDRVLQGMTITRAIDAQVKCIKKGNVIRRRINAPMK